MTSMRSPFRSTLLRGLLLSLGLALTTPWVHAKPEVPRTADYILAVVNRELVTAGELQLRMGQLREEARRNGGRPPTEVELREPVLNLLINERVLVTHAREVGQKIDDAELDRAVANVAAQNQLTVVQLRERLRAEGVDYNRFRSNIRDQMLVERVREREVQARIRISDADIDTWLERQRASAAGSAHYDIAQVLISVPENAEDRAVAAQKARAEAALARVKSGEAFDAVAHQVSDDLNKAQGGRIGLRPADQLPDVFVQAVKTLKAGEISAQVLRTGAGFHVLKLLERREGQGAAAITQTRARHILLRPTAKANEDAVIRRVREFKRQIESGKTTFEQIARESSEDGSASQGGDLGWVSPGGFVPEFEEAMNALAINAISDPVVSRFGVHLIQVTERRETQLDAKQQREQARNALREQRFEAANAEWVRELRALAYVEMREAPQ